MPRPRHRPSGARASDRQFKIESAAYLVRIGKQAFRRRHGTTSNPTTVVERLTIRAIALIGLNDDAENRAHATVLRQHRDSPNRDVVDYVRDDLPAAIETITA